VQLAEDGLLICARCEHWYAIDDGIVRMLPDGLRVRAADEAFIDKRRNLFGSNLCERLGAMSAAISYSEGANQLLSHFDVPIKAKDRTRNVNHRLKFEEILGGIGEIGTGNCLELACGNGSHAASLLEAYPNIGYVGIDIAPIRLRETRERIGRRENVLLVQATLDVLPFRDNAFSAVYTASALQYLEDPVFGLSEARRVLKKNGSFTSLDYNPKCYASAFSVMREKQKYDTQIDKNLYEKMSRKNLGEWMSGSGFSDVRISNFLFLPGNIPLPLFGYKMINGFLQRIPYIRDFSIMHMTYAKKLDSGARST
jgi:ubiquinone/menaquinone biosynthesis C-methylase UbiE